jgi:hypothetical protein
MASAEASKEETCNPRMKPVESPSYQHIGFPKKSSTEALGSTFAKNNL